MLKHYRYNYIPEYSPKNIFYYMTKSNLEENGYFLPNNIEINSEIGKLYFSRRKYLITLIKTIHSSISYNSQSYFLCIFLMDIIFLKENLFQEFFYFFPSKIPSNDIKLNNYILLSLGCLIISYKFNGNNSMLYPLNNIMKIIYYISGEKFGFSKKDLCIGEAFIIKLLKYKLNFYTVYHYLTFFFSHGIIFRKNLPKKNLIEKKFLEKIYTQARQLLDYIIEQNKYFELLNGKFNYITACQIIKWASEKVLNIKIKNDENIFRVIYNINISESMQKKFYEIIEEKNKEKKIIKTKSSNFNFKENQFIYNSPQSQYQIKKNSSIYINNNINSESEYNYASPTNANLNQSNNNILSITSNNINEDNNEENIKNKKEPSDNLKKRNKQLKIIPMKKSINRQNTQKLFLKTGDNINFNFDNKNEDYKSPSNNNQKIKFNNELKIESKDIINKSKILKKISKEKKNLKDNSNSSYIFYQNTYNTMNSFTSNNKANTELVNSKVHKAQGDEPKDNCSKIRRIKSKMIKRKINSNSNSNTIIINNNMQINTFINNDNNNNYKDVNFQPQIINIVLNGKK